ncbi:MAG: tRNA dihydrouridine synthase DusB [Zetaproteobacteria bacterium]|nr:MAG: tRNA dihydrouridine synthase DusB [Zetaproteobacteria bacterium]
MTRTNILPPLRLGAHTIDVPLVLAPMAGITDLPFRRICRRFGVGLTVTEMVASRAVDMKRARTQKIAQVAPDEHPVAIQIAGSDPQYMRQAAQWAVAQGADFVDINMGCPVKKVCKQLAGSAMLRDERLVRRVLDAVVQAVQVPVTLKIRTGWDERSKNVATIARIAEDAGVQMLTVHGRTRAQMFHGHASWEDIGLAKQAVSIPVIGNGDIVDGASARAMLAVSGCDGVMVGRAVQGNPWVLAEVRAALLNETPPPPPTPAERWRIVEQHLRELCAHHGQPTASRLARKHVPWYSKGLPGSAAFRSQFQQLHDWQAQLDAARRYFLSLPEDEQPVAYAA